MTQPASGHTELISAGGVVRKRAEHGNEFALICVGERGRWQLPKGLVDPGESFEETALREVREETGLTCRVTGGLGHIDYWFDASYEGPVTRYHKSVHFYLMEFESGDITDHDEEVSEVRWFAEETAVSALAFDSEREIVRKAIAILAEEAA